MEKLTKQTLIEKVIELYETDEGDFKRKNALYLNRFIEQQKSQELKKELQNIKNEFLYYKLPFKDSTNNIENLRNFLLEKIKKLPQA